MKKSFLSISLVIFFLSTSLFNISCNKDDSDINQSTTPDTNQPTTPEDNLGADGVYTITFETNGGTQINNQNVLPAERFYSPLRHPAKDGFAFDGFYTNPETTELYNFAAKSNSDVILYAKWTTITIEKLTSLHDYGQLLYNDHMIKSEYKIECYQFLTRAEGIINGTSNISRLESTYNDLANMLANNTLEASTK